MTPFVLGALVIIDAAFCGFRAAAGRNPRLFLRRYYARSMLRGALFGVVTIGVFFALAQGDWPATLQGAESMARIFIVFAALTLTAISLYLTGSFDFGVLASVLMLGPFTVIRPVVIVFGGVAGAVASGTVFGSAWCLAAAVTMVFFERLLDFGSPPWRGLEGDQSLARR